MCDIYLLRHLLKVEDYTLELILAASYNMQPFGVKKTN